MNNYNQDNNQDEQDFTYRTLFRNYIRYINNSNQFLNSSIDILTSQQSTYNNLINHYNTVINPNGTTYDYNLNRPRYYPYRPSPLSRYTFPLPRRNVIVTNLPNSVQDQNNANLRPRPSVSHVANAISYHIYENIDISTNCTCPITQRDFTNNETVVMINRCKHIFDPLSILNWFARCDSCPLCRASIIDTPESIYTYTNSNNNHLTQDNHLAQDNNLAEDNHLTEDNHLAEDNHLTEDTTDENNNETYRYYTEFLNNTRSQIQNIRNTIRNRSLNSQSLNNSNNFSNNFANNLAQVINNEINRDLDFSGNILIELGITPR